jgi:signal transduction histidine kinase
MTTSPNFDQLDLIACPLFVLDTRQLDYPVYVAFNAWARRNSTRPLTDYIGKTARDVYPSAHGQAAFRHHQDAARNGETVTYEIDLPIDGKLRSTRTTLTPDLDASGRVTHLYGYSEDTTDWREAQERRVRFDALTSEMEQFVSVAAHDLRTPMRHVAVLADMLREDFVDHGDGKLGLLAMLEDVACKSMSLISDVLAHANAAVPEGMISQFCFASLCEDICDVLDPQNRHVVTYSQSILLSDRAAMQVVLRNILDMVLRQGAQDRLKIDIISKSGPEGMIEVALDDNGHGFELPAVNILRGQALEEGGHGRYGLAGVRRLVSTRGGAIKIRPSTEHSGSVIEVALPGSLITATAPELAGRFAKTISQTAATRLSNER